MAKARNYLSPSMVVHQSFVDDASTAAVPALVHISGPHANFIEFGSDTESLGHIGKYDRTTGLHLELPRILAGNVLDLDSTRVTLRDAALKYFSATTESFVIPAGSRNIIEASQADQEAGFSFKQNGEHNRSLVFGDRDVRVGGTVSSGA